MAKRMGSKRRQRRRGPHTTTVQQLSLWDAILDSMMNAFGGSAGTGRESPDERQTSTSISIQWLSAEPSWLMNVGSILDLGATSEAYTQLPPDQATYYALRSDHLAIALDAQNARARILDMLQRQAS